MAKRLILIPEELFERLKEKNIEPESFEEIVKNKKLTPDQKAKLIIQKQLKFKRKQAERRKRKTAIELSEEDGIIPIERTVFEMIPSTSKKRITALLDFLYKHKDIRWHPETGELELYNEVIPNSNIAEILNVVASPRRNLEAEGMNDFIDFLARSNVNKFLIPNQHIRRILGEVKPENESEWNLSWEAF